MSEFFIRVLKWLAALITAYALLFFMLFLLLIGISVAFQPVPEKMEKGSIIVLDLGAGLSEQPSSGDTAALVRDALSGEVRESVSLREAIKGLEKASNDSDVTGLLLTGNLVTEGYGGSFATLREFRAALTAFGEKKPVWAFIQRDSLRDYYVKSAATEVINDPFAMVDFRGLRAERLYLGEAFERLGIEFQIEAFEEFKTAGESLQSGSMSEAEREQLTALIEDLWDSLLLDISASRGVAAKDLDSLADSDLILYADEITEHHLSDLSLNEDEFNAKLIKEAGPAWDGKSFLQFDFADYLFKDVSLATSVDFMSSNDTVAILHIEGLIMDGESADGIVGAVTINDHLRDLRMDSSVKAIVLRVNSPGGGADASHRIVRGINLTKAEKPVVVSMGGIATSGGYMVAALGDRVFAQPTTITGSIGVVSMLPNIEQLAEKLSVNFDGVETNKFSGTFSLGRSKTEEEMRQVRALGAQSYNDFMRLVAVNRNMALRQVRPLAKGRVWSGKAAVQVGLADEEGGLMDAVRRAAEMAELAPGYTIKELPRALTLEEQIQEMLVGSGAQPAQSGMGLKSLVSDLETEIKRISAFDDPRGQYFLLPYSLKIN
jgi:protease-4